MGLLHQRLPALQDAEAEIWPLEPSIMHFRWSGGLQTQYGDVVVETWDASRHGIAISVTVSALPGQVYHMEGMCFEPSSRA